MLLLGGEGKNSNNALVHHTIFGGKMRLWEGRWSEMVNNFVQNFSMSYIFSTNLKENVKWIFINENHHLTSLNFLTKFTKSKKFSTPKTSLIYWATVRLKIHGGFLVKLRISVNR